MSKRFFSLIVALVILVVTFCSCENDLPQTSSAFTKQESQYSEFETTSVDMKNSGNKAQISSKASYFSSQDGETSNQQSDMSENNETSNKKTSITRQSESKIESETYSNSETESSSQNEREVINVPDELRTVVKNNLFRDITAFDGRLLKKEFCSADEKNKDVIYNVQMMDIYGKVLAVYKVKFNDAYHITTLTATEDGGFLFVVGFEDYAYSVGSWASDNGFASRIIKCDKNGKLMFDTALKDVEGSALRFCYEKNGKYYLFGTKETPSTKRKGVLSPTDVYMTVLDKKGTVLKTKCIAGSNYDKLDASECVENGFKLSINSQSDDGEFAGSNSRGFPIDWVITVNDNLEIIEKKKETGREYFDTVIGEKEGLAIYESDKLLNNFDAGTPNAFIDYDNYYLIISENITGEYENTPRWISSTWYYTETVYSGYDGNGNLIFRASIDSSPDYDAIVEEYKKYEK